MQVATVGLALAKNIFQVDGITADGTVALNKSLRHVQLLPLFETLDACLIGKRLAVPATTGRGSSKSWAMKSG